MWVFFLKPCFFVCFFPENHYEAYQQDSKEVLVLKKAITDRFHEYLYGGTFDIYTDNNPLT